jgi:hypothetical protein
MTAVTGMPGASCRSTNSTSYGQIRVGMGLMLRLRHSRVRISRARWGRAVPLRYGGDGWGIVLSLTVWIIVGRMRARLAMRLSDRSLSLSRLRGLSLRLRLRWVGVSGSKGSSSRRGVVVVVVYRSRPRSTRLVISIRTIRCRSCTTRWLSSLRPQRCS